MIFAGAFLIELEKEAAAVCEQRAFLIGFLGIGNVIDVMAKKYGIKNENGDLQK